MGNARFNNPVALLLGGGGGGGRDASPQSDQAQLLRLLRLAAASRGNNQDGAAAAGAGAEDEAVAVADGRGARRDRRLLQALETLAADMQSGALPDEGALLQEVDRLESEGMLCIPCCVVGYLPSLFSLSFSLFICVSYVCVYVCMYVCVCMHQYYLSSSVSVCLV